MPPGRASIRTVQEPIETTISRLETFVARMERRYEIESEAAADAVERGDMRETAEVAKWLISYRTLQRLKGHAGRSRRSTTSSTR